MRTIWIGLAAAVVACNGAASRRAIASPDLVAIARVDCELLSAGRSAGAQQIEALGDARVLKSDAPSIRSRAMGVSWQGERLHVASHRGPGAVVKVAMPIGACYIGQGVFFGWAQEALAAAHRQLTAPASPRQALLD